MNMKREKKLPVEEIWAIRSRLVKEIAAKYPMRNYPRLGCVVAFVINLIKNGPDDVRPVLEQTAREYGFRSFDDLTATVRHRTNENWVRRNILSYFAE